MKINEHVYDSIKESLCPICLVFECVLHTPAVPEPGESGNENYYQENPFILNEPY